MIHSGRCQCGNVCYEAAGEPKVVSLCHCVDCQRSSGAPVMAWAEFPEEALTVTQGAPKTYNSSGASIRSFCPDCGSGLFYRNAEILPGLVEIQSATLDDAAALAPTMQIQTAERLGWMEHIHEIPAFDRFPE
jgi:hypothetical protein